ncbi:MAG TPA: heat-inducible transcriptional repressor HrcA [Ignavibacteria bacterium]|nr:heat-inducible transcriptional repressor HrcA [Ignavibacteria bacterium]
MNEILSDREKEVLKYVVDNYIRNAAPVGSRSVSKQTDLNLSPATIRNVMSDLEEMDLLNTPHTSAGRIPTDKGYRYYVDILMNKERLSLNEEYTLKSRFDEKNFNILESQELFEETSRILGKISHLLAVVSQPQISKGIFEKLEFVIISSSKILIVLNINSGFVKTVIMEISSEITKARLEKLATFLNQRLHGLSLREIRDTFIERVSDYKYEEPELIQLFINSFDRLYNEDEKGSRIYFSGTSELILQPEFENPKNFKEIIHLAEDKNLVVHIFENSNKADNKVFVSIGNENTDEKLKNYSVVATNYKVGDVSGNIGVIGPKRMNYARMISLLQYTSKLINEIPN